MTKTLIALSVLIAGISSFLLSVHSQPSEAVQTEITTTTAQIPVVPSTTTTAVLKVEKRTVARKIVSQTTPTTYPPPRSAELESLIPDAGHEGDPEFNVDPDTHEHMPVDTTVSQP